jgi:hypothetical protein
LPPEATAGSTTSRRLLQGTVLALSVVPIGAGGAGVLLGPALVGAGGTGSVDLDSHFRYLSGLLLAIGLLFVAAVPRIERHGFWFRTGAAIVVCGGLARLLSLVQAGAPSPPHLAALAIELVVVPLLALWQAAVARGAEPDAKDARERP